MTLAAAQKLASDRHADLIHIDTQREPIFVLVDEEMWSRLDLQQTLPQILSGLDQTPPV